MSFFEKLKDGLRRTRESVSYGLSTEKLDDAFYEELEEALILTDAGVTTASSVVEALREEVKKRHILDASEARTLLAKLCAERLRADAPMNLSGDPAVILLVGVNGAGKTTTAGKLAAHYKAAGRTVLMGAADTFRAAAVEQLEQWAKRAGCDMIRGSGDPSAVIYDTVSAARARGCDLAICDTAGRLQNKKNLMDELSKMVRTVQKAAPGASVEVLLVLDAITGQNALSQAEQFAKGAGVTGIVLTKLDGTAKGGSVLAIKDRLGIPVRFIGVGESIADLDAFDPDAFCRAMFTVE